MQKQRQLRRIELLAFRPEELAHQQVDLLFQQQDLRIGMGKLLVAGLEFGQEFGFARVSHQWGVRLTRTPTPGTGFC